MLVLHGAECTLPLPGRPLEAEARSHAVCTVFPSILAVKGVWKMEISGMISANKLSRACQGFVIDRPRPNAQDSCISLPIPTSSQPEQQRLLA